MGAWIETLFFTKIQFQLLVAPYVGAWIETMMPRQSRVHHTSHPMWVRGLKRQFSYDRLEKGGSHPMWVRGLKLILTSQKL